MAKTILLLRGCYYVFFYLALPVWTDVVVVVSGSSAPVAAAGCGRARDPLLLRAARGEVVERFPVWMMRQAGRHMLAYQNLAVRYPTFRQRSETPDISRTISLQPLERYGIDGVILFSDILTPLPAMGVDFDVTESGEIRIEPIRTQEELNARLKRATKEEYKEKCQFVGSVLQQLKQQLTESSPDTTLLGFVGLPFTLASYLVEGQTGTSTKFSTIRALLVADPQLCRTMLSLLADNIIHYACYQIESGAHVMQVFDSWAGHIDDNLYEEFCHPYQQRVVRGIRKEYPEVPIIIYMAPGPYSSGGRRLEALARTGANIVSVDHTVDIALARAILSDDENIGLQGNLDPQLLRDGPLDAIRSKTLSILTTLKGRRRCILNLGHGVQADTPEAHAECFIRTVRSFQIDEKDGSPVKSVFNTSIE